MNELFQRILEAKKQQRKKLAALPFEEKVVILEKLRDRSLLIAQSPLRDKSKRGEKS